MKINKQSRFYRFLCFFTNIDLRHQWQINVCDLTKYFIQAVLKLIFTIAAACLVVGMGGFCFYALYNAAVHDPKSFLTAICIVASPFAVATLVILALSYKASRAITVMYKEPGPISMMYRSWKEKMCFWIELE